MIEGEALARFAVFEELTERELESVAKLASEERRGRGAKIIAEGAPAKSFYLVREGKVAVMMTSPSGQEIKVDEIGPGEVFGWSAVVDRESFTAGVCAIEDCRLIVMNGEQLRHLLEVNNHIGFRVTKSIAGVISRRLSSLRSALLEEASSNVLRQSPARLTQRSLQ